MAHLTDLEELLATIPGSDIRDYMREAMNCYMAGAYRGTLVLSYIALFDDLLIKLGELGQINADAKQVHTDAVKRKGDQDVYENFLIDQLTSKNLITVLDGSFLTTLKSLRNKSAHPSGHKPSAEEARFVFFETVSRFLAKPILSTTHLVDQLVARLSNSNFFPSTTVADITSVVVEETKTLHDEAMTQLVAKVCKEVLSPDATRKANAVCLLIGLARLERDSSKAALQSKLIVQKADDASYANVITQTISANGKLVVGLTPATVGRIRAVLSKKIEETTNAVAESKLLHPTSALSSIAATLPVADLLAVYKPEFEALFAKRAHSTFVVKLVQDCPALLPLYMPQLLARAGSSTFDVAKSVATAIDSLDAPLAALLSDEQALQLVAAIIKTAEWGTWAAKGVVNSKFSDAPALRAKARAFVEANGAAASAYLATELGATLKFDSFVADHLTDDVDTAGAGTEAE